MGAEIGVARRRRASRRGGAGASPRRVAPGALGDMAVIDEQRRARAGAPAGRRGPPASAAAAGQISTIVPGGESRSAGGTSRLAARALRPVGKGTGRRRVERDDPLGPPPRPRTNCRIGSASRNSLATSSSGPSGTSSRSRQPDAVRRRRGARLLLGAQHRARLDQIQPQRAAKSGTAPAARRKSAISTPRPGPSSARMHRVGPAHPLPQIGAPQPDQLAENLADLRRGDEIAAAPSGSRRRVIARLGIVQRHRHKGGDRERPLGADAPGDLVREPGLGSRPWRAAGVRAAPSR